MKNFPLKKVIIASLAKAKWLFRLVEASSQLQHPKFLVHFAIWAYFIKGIKVNIKEAQPKKITQYKSFIDFFTRQLSPEQRPIASQKNAIISPVDAKIVSAGTLQKNSNYIIKGKPYSISSLLPPSETLQIKKASATSPAQKILKCLYGGTYISQYLSPRDYHRIHMPINAQIVSVTFLGEQTLPVNDFALTNYGDVFKKNRRAVILAKGNGFSFAMVLITALNVGHINLHFDANLSAKARQNRTTILHKNYNDLKLKKGDDIAAFHLGSSVFSIFEKNKIILHHAATTQKNQTSVPFMLMGQQLAYIKPKKSNKTNL